MSALAALADQGIHADRTGLHVMAPEVLQSAHAMQEECKEFLSKTKEFNDIVSDFIEVMESKSKIIEGEKLKAIGLGNRVDHEKEVRKRKQVRQPRRPSLAIPCARRSHVAYNLSLAVPAVGAAGDDQREEGGARASQPAARIAPAGRGGPEGAHREAHQQRGVSSASLGVLRGAPYRVCCLPAEIATRP